MFSHRSSVSRWLAVVCVAAFVALVGLGVGCSKDDIVGSVTAEAVEQGLNKTLTKTVDPLVAFFKAVPAIATGGGTFRSAFGGVVCPNTAGVCGGGGTTACTVTGGGTTLTFDFDQCVVVTGDVPFTLDGGLVVTPGAGTYGLQLNALFIDSSPAMTGTGTVTVGTCSYEVNVNTTDPASVVGTIIQCDADNYPTAASGLTVSFDNFVIEITFDGSSTADAAATNDGTLVANCDINLAADPLTSSCHAP